MIRENPGGLQQADIKNMDLGRFDVELVPLFIEPLDAIEIGAWLAKANGILTVAENPPL